MGKYLGLIIELPSLTDLSCFDVEFWKAKYKELKKEYKKEVAELEEEIRRLRDYW